jgi:hypothetical protein
MNGINFNDQRIPAGTLRRIVLRAEIGGSANRNFHRSVAVRCAAIDNCHGGINMVVFLLVHQRDEGDPSTVKIIGIYSSRDSGEQAIERARALPGFTDAPDSFCLDPYELDADYWTTGFVSLDRNLDT